MKDPLGSHIESGNLLHPLRGESSSVELFTALAQLGGAEISVGSDGVSKIVDVIGVYDHYLFVLVDGLGLSLADRFPDGGFFKTAYSRELRSVFPSTTAVAMTSIATATWPVQHGITGWHTFFPELHRVITPLLFQERFTEVEGIKLGLSVDDLIPIPSQLPSYVRQTHSFLPHPIQAAPYAQWSRGGTPMSGYRSLRQAVSQVTSRIRSPDGPTFTYLYLTSVDTLCHHCGTRSEEVRNDIERIDAALAQIRKRLSQRVRIVVSADHGLIDIPAEQRLIVRPDDPLMDHLVVPPTAEGRTPVFHVVPGHKKDFARDFSEHILSESFVLVPSQDLSAAGYLGPGEPSLATANHWGDFVGIATRPAVLEYVPPGQPPLGHHASHGGLHPDEVRVPLFLA